MPLSHLEERDSDEDHMIENEFPYMKGRLKAIDYEAIIEKGEPWKDPIFPHGKYCLFINHQSPQKPSPSKQKWVDKFHWKRASEYFEDGFEVFDGIDPDDIIMGSCNDCYMFAALAGMAEGTSKEVTMEEKGARIKDNFLVTKVNSAGCYAIQFIIDGQPRTIVVDDYFPFMYTKGGKEVFAFAKTKTGENEIWV